MIQSRNAILRSFSSQTDDAMTISHPPTTFTKLRSSSSSSVSQQNDLCYHRVLNIGVPLMASSSEEESDDECCRSNPNNVGSATSISSNFDGLSGNDLSLNRKSFPMMVSSSSKQDQDYVMLAGVDDATVQISNRSSKRYSTRSNSPTLTAGFKVSEMWGQFIERAAEQAKTASSSSLNGKRVISSHYSGVCNNSATSRRPSKFNFSAKFPTPLYEAVTLKAQPYVLRRLIAVHPAALNIPNAVNGSLPLHCAIERYDTSVEVIELLLQSNPNSASVRNSSGLSPLDLLWRRYVAPDESRCEQVKVRACIIRRTMEGLMLSRSWSALEKDHNGKSKLMTEEFRTFWDLFSKFLRAAYHGFGLPIHAVLTVMDRPDPLLVQFLCCAFPSHLLTKDPNNRFVPLHILAQSPHKEGQRIDMLRLLFILLDANINATKEKDKYNRTPLHVALRSGKPWAFLKLLVTANPKALHESDGNTGLIPFLLASAIDANRSSKHVDTNTVFSLLRADPTVLEKFLLT